MARTALLAGKHVICEKPFTTDASTARELALLAESTGLTAMMAHEFRFTSGRMRAKELIESGYIGDLQLAIVRVLFGRPADDPAEYSALADDASTGAGVLFNQGSHYIDGLRHLFGDISAVSGADAVTLKPERVRDGAVVLADAEDTFITTLHFVKGGRAQITASRVLPFSADAGLEIYGTTGALRTPQATANPPYRGRVLGAHLEGAGFEELEIPARLTPFDDDRDDRMVPFRLLVREFLRGIEQGCSPEPNFTDGYRCQQVLDAIRLASKEGRSVAIDLD
jgi:predicted dehydrogenase